jgi:hypothetical protein
MGAAPLTFIASLTPTSDSPPLGAPAFRGSHERVRAVRVENEIRRPMVSSQARIQVPAQIRLPVRLNPKGRGETVEMKTRIALCPDLRGRLPPQRGADQPFRFHHAGKEQSEKQHG